MKPTTEPAKRIATLFKRRLTTSWAVKEVKAYKILVKQGCFNNPDDLCLVETYYVFNERKPDNYLRKDLYTFLNNWHGEVDRARSWAAHHKAKVKKANPNHHFGTASEEDFRNAGLEARRMVEELRTKLNAQS